MTETTQHRASDFIAISSEVVSAYVSNNPVRPSDLPALIASVHATLLSISNGVETAGAGAQDDTVEQPTEAQIRKSIHPDGIVSFIDGKTYKTMKRHLSGHGLNAHSYRAKYGLPVSYPMVAASYSAIRSALAKNTGLGRPGSMAA